VLVHHKMGDIGEGPVGPWGVPDGGMGAATQALRPSAEALGAEIRISAEVVKIKVAANATPRRARAAAGHTCRLVAGQLVCEPDSGSGARTARLPVGQQVWRPDSPASGRSRRGHPAVT
jgi:phytoene dehydrogenase-like protein